jgi:hypothetical protein
MSLAFREASAKLRQRFHAQSFGSRPSSSPLQPTFAQQSRQRALAATTVHLQDLLVSSQPQRRKRGDLVASTELQRTHQQLNQEAVVRRNAALALIAPLKPWCVEEDPNFIHAQRVLRAMAQFELSSAVPSLLQPLLDLHLKHTYLMDAQSASSFMAVLLKLHRWMAEERNSGAAAAAKVTSQVESGRTAQQQVSQQVIHAIGVMLPRLAQIVDELTPREMSTVLECISLWRTHMAAATHSVTSPTVDKTASEFFAFLTELETVLSGELLTHLAEVSVDEAVKILVSQSRCPGHEPLVLSLLQALQGPLCALLVESQATSSVDLLLTVCRTLERAVSRGERRTATTMMPLDLDDVPRQLLRTIGSVAVEKLPLLSCGHITLVLRCFQATSYCDETAILRLSTGCLSAMTRSPYHPRHAIQLIRTLSMFGLGGQREFYEALLEPVLSRLTAPECLIVASLWARAVLHLPPPRRGGASVAPWSVMPFTALYAQFRSDASAQTASNIATFVLHLESLASAASDTALKRQSTTSSGAASSSREEEEEGSDLAAVVEAAKACTNRMWQLVMSVPPEQYTADEQLVLLERVSKSAQWKDAVRKHFGVV